ncbi:MAG TPA: AAA family ATPase [Saprospiraceae bacterium]|nr:AAA family ATPase [Saprospiraceae bacterium]HMQ82974.1 AAA family ATPase [Saprospiraceae bacterium]
MKISKIHLRNLNSLRLEQTIDFDVPPLGNSGLFAITGDTGAGKSTLLDAMSLALYGKIPRNNDVKEVMSYGAVDSFAEVEFQSKGKRYRASWTIWRARKKEDGNIQGPVRRLAVWNEKKEAFEIIAEKIAEVDQQVEEITGLDYDRFSRSVMLSQGDFAAFLKAGERSRSELLERITGTEVYSQLSKSAYERHKLEAQQLETLQNSLKNLDLLSPEEAEALQRDIAANKSISEVARKQLEKLRSKIQSLERLQQLSAKIGEARENVQQLEEIWDKAQTEFEKLSFHQKALSFQPEAKRLDELQQELTELEASKRELASTLNEQQASEQQQQQALASLELQNQELQTHLREKLPIWEEAQALDIQIREKQGPLQERVSTRQQQEAALTDLQLQLSHSKKEEENSSQRLLQLATWLEQHEHWSQLITDFPAIQLKREVLRNLFKRRQTLEEAQQISQQEHQQYQAKLQELNLQLATLQQEESRLKTAFSEALPENYAESRSELIELLVGEIEALNEQKKQLEALYQLTDNYQELLQKLSTYEEELAGLLSRESNLNKDLMNSMEALDAASHRLEFKRSVLEQQTLIANYEKDRQELEEGQPCPLCFSTQHPFREHHIKPFVDEAQQEMESAAQSYKLIYEHHRKLLRSQNDLESRIDQIRGSEVKQLSGQVEQMFEQILSYEEKISKVAPELNAETYAMSRSRLLMLKIQDSDKAIRQKQELRQRLSQILRELNQVESRLQELDNHHKEVKTKLLLQEERLQNQSQQWQEIQQTYDTEVNLLNLLLQPYHLVFDLQTAAQTFEILESQKKEWENNQQEQNALSRRLELLIQENRQKLERQHELTLVLEKSREEEKLAQTILAELLQKRQALLGERDPKAERDALQAQIAEAEQSWQIQSSSLKNLAIQIASSKRAMEEKQAQEERLARNQYNLEQQWLESIKGAGFLDMEHWRNSLLSPEEASRLSHEKMELENQRLEWLRRLQNLEEELEQEQRKSRSDESLEELLALQVEQEANFEALQQHIGALQQKMQFQEVQSAKAADLKRAIAEQRKTSARWARLNDIIGSADGKKFRAYAQGLTLQKLSQLANQHLQRLNGRYLIHKSIEKDLELEIVDTFQADNRRSMNTLSGGESFLVSLALALGLSDLAGRDVRIQSLFIDEGFGTLDDNALDLAISTLENLQATGKTIGIISHVNALKERIATQIRVVKKGNGFSVVELAH